MDDKIEEIEKRSEKKEEENKRLIQENKPLIQENQCLIKKNSACQPHQVFGITVAQHQASGLHQTSWLSFAQKLFKAQVENRLLKDKVRTLQATLAERNHVIQRGEEYLTNYEEELRSQYDQIKSLKRIYIFHHFIYQFKMNLFILFKKLVKSIY